MESIKEPKEFLKSLNGLKEMVEDVASDNKNVVKRLVIILFGPILVSSLFKLLQEHPETAAEIKELIDMLVDSAVEVSKKRELALKLARELTNVAQKLTAEKLAEKKNNTEANLKE